MTCASTTRLIIKAPVIREHLIPIFVTNAGAMMDPIVWKIYKIAKSVKPSSPKPPCSYMVEMIFCTHMKGIYIIKN